MTYIIRSTKLSQEFIDSEIKKCLEILNNTNQMVLDYWLSELYIEDTDNVKRSDAWCEENLQLIYEDVMCH